MLVEVAQIAERRMARADSRTDMVEANLDVLNEIVTELGRSQKLTDEQLKLTDEQLKLTDEQLKGLAASQERTYELLKELAASQRRTDEQFKRTDKRLSSLADLIERHIREGHGGKSSS